MVPTCITVLERAARYFATRPAVRYEDRELTFGECWDRGLRLARALEERGLQVQDRVATLEDNRVPAVDTYLACAANNMVRVPLYPRNSVDAHAHMLTITESKILLVDSDMASDDVMALPQKVSTLREVFVRDAGYDGWIADHVPVERIVQASEDDIHLIRFSGGTTGFPKGIPLSNRVWMCQLRDICFTFDRIMPGDVTLHAGTFSHGSGYLFIPTWSAGGVNHLAVGFDAEKIIDLMESSKTSFMFLAPSQLAALVRAKNAKGRKFERLKSLWIAGAPITPETALLSREVFGERVYQMFAQTEIAPGCTMPPCEWFADTPGSKPLEAAGRVSQWTELEIRDEENKPLPNGEIGEIALRADGQMTGYLGPPELSADKVVDGWILTGDVGYLDANGFLYIVDRKGATIISGGYNIWPAELEKVIEAMPDVEQVVVVPIPDDRWGETPLAICVAREGSTLSEQQIVDECRRRLGSYKKPGKVKIQTERLPMTPVGKIDRRMIKEPYWAGRTKRVAGT